VFTTVVGFLATEEDEPMRAMIGMKTNVLAVILALIPILAGCSFAAPPPATATPTPTNTPFPTSTDTPFPTATPTKPPPPLMISGCLSADTCASAKPIRNYFETPLNYNVRYSIDVYTSSEVWFSFEWCAIDQVTLDQNIANLEFEFTIDGVPYLETLSQGYTSMQDDASVSHPCYSIGGVLSGWRSGSSYQIVIGVTLLTDTFNGWNTFGAGDYLNVFLANKIDLPTPEPTRTPEPIIVPPTLAPCNATAVFRVSNLTSQPAILYLSGPASYAFTAEPGGSISTYLICPGGYSYTEVVCGNTRFGEFSVPARPGFSFHCW
jgi:hypothetical protein